MIGAMSRAGARLAEPRYVAAAERAAAFVLSNLVDGAGGGLLHAYREGRAHVPAFLDDYAFLVEGLLQLHGATGERRWLDEAARLAREQERRLGDAEGGGWFSAGEDEHLLVRAKPAFDGAVASGNGVAALNAVALWRATGDVWWAGRAEAAVLAFADGIEQAPLAHVTLARALERLLEAPRPAPTVAAATESKPAAAQPAAAAEALEEEAYEAAELEGRLGSSDDDDWKPFRVEIAVRTGWHLNAHPAGAGLVATAVAGVVGRLRNVRYPAGETWDGGAGPVPVYRGRVAIEGEVERSGGGAAGVEVTYQACDDARCLPPVTRIVRLR
jgi:hypothetical protein